MAGGNSSGKPANPFDQAFGSALVDPVIAPIQRGVSSFFDVSAPETVGGVVLTPPPAGPPTPPPAPPAIEEPAVPGAAPQPPPEQRDPALYLRDSMNLAGGPVVKAGFVPVKRASTAEIDKSVTDSQSGANMRARGEKQIADVDKELSRNLDISGQARQWQLQQDAKDEAAAAARLQQRLADHEAAMEKARNEFLAESKAINPYRRFTDGTANTIFSSLALVLGSTGDALTHSDKFAKTWQAELDREFEVQKQRLQDKRFALSDQAQQFYRITSGAKSEAEAKDRWKAAQTQAFTQHVDNLRQQADGKKVQGRLDSVLGALKQEEAKFDLSAREKTYAAHVQENLADAAHGSAAELAYAGDVNKRGDIAASSAAGLMRPGPKDPHAPVQFPGGIDPDTKQPFAIRPQMVDGEKGLAKQGETVLGIRGDIQRARDIIAEYGSGTLPATVQAELKSRLQPILTNIASAKSQLAGAGAPVNKEIEDAAQVLLSDGWYGLGTKPLDALDDSISRAWSDKMRMYAKLSRGEGYDLTTARPSRKAPK